MKTALLRTFVETRREALTVDTAARLDRLCLEAPEFCVRVLGDVRTHVSQKARLLAGLVRSEVERGEIVGQLHLLADDDLLRVLDGLRQRRLNGRRVRGIGLAALVGHSRFVELCAHHRQRVVRILRHLLGERTWSSVARFLAERTPEGDQFVQTNVLRFAADSNGAREALGFLAGLGFDRPEPVRTPWLVVPWRRKAEPEPFALASDLLRRSAAARHDLNAGQGMPRATLSGLCGTYHRDASRRTLRELAAPVSRRERTDGVVTAALKEAFAGGGNSSLEDLVRSVVDGNLPVVDVRAAVVLDLSGSTVSSGERLYHPAALGLAVVGLLQQLVRDLNVFQVGGTMVLNGDGIPRPQGATDLATAILEAARDEPEAILVVTDGFENFRQGDAAQVVAGLRRLGVTTVIEQVTPVVAAAEDLSRRRLSAEVPVVPVEHEASVGELASRLLLAGQPEEFDAGALPVVTRLLLGV